MRHIKAHPPTFFLFCTRIKSVLTTNHVISKGARLEVLIGNNIIGHHSALQSQTNKPRHHQSDKPLDPQLKYVIVKKDSHNLIN